MKIVFVHIGREHLGIEHLSSVLKQEGIDVELAYDPALFTAEDNVIASPLLAKLFSRRRRIIKQILTAKADVLAFSSYTSNYQSLLSIAYEIRQQSTIPIVFGGTHPTLVPDEVIRHACVDYVIRGEGEYPLLELLLQFGDTASYHTIRNLWFKNNGTVIKNELRPPLQDISALPIVDKALFEKEIRHQDDYLVLGSRGCPCSCTYCCESYYNKTFANTFFRLRSIDSLMRELCVMKERYHFQAVTFFDNILSADKQWAYDLFKEYKRNIRVPFRCEGHVSFASLDIIRALKDAGCYSINFGLQSFDEKLRKNILNRHETNEQVKEIFSICDAEKLPYDIDIMLGLPTMTKESYCSAISFMENHPMLNRLKCYNLTYFPNLSIVEKAKQCGMLDAEDMQLIREGKSSNYFHDHALKDPHLIQLKNGFECLYKLYPLLPKSLRTYAIEGNNYRYFAWIPKPVIIIIQLIIASFKKDYRFYIYIQRYLSIFPRWRKTDRNTLKKP